MLDNWFLTSKDLDIMTFGSDLLSLGPNFQSPEALINAVDHFTAYNAATTLGACPLNAYEAHQVVHDPKERLLQCQLDKMIDNNCIYDGADDDNPLLHLAEDEDKPDPFHCPESLNSQEHNLSANAPHVLAMYVVASWLHLQFHLPQVACNALLTIFILILMSICPMIETPFITLQSSNCVLGLDRPVHILPVCPSCCDIFPPAGLPHCQDQCILCNIDLFLPSQTKCSNPQEIKTPIISYPYLPLYKQIKSLLKIPGLEAVLDAW
ncbi:hypothetical protein PAXRUDRAFT_35714 [Paxillus rubicundulus Ve08.2h10]|uniref:Uncharacterized protein n=1 Tax=Paxillus rubicundulus Ve08.2h10 TaxID=930991 RepID=A0A0D0CH30_9AGAM|nr:hypothetical protein PAXRUDRAFT_35714 [Paxillus rubicundulus Ve08.2h10]